MDLDILVEQYFDASVFGHSEGEHSDQSFCFFITTMAQTGDDFCFDHRTSMVDCVFYINGPFDLFLKCFSRIGQVLPDKLP